MDKILVDTNMLLSQFEYAFDLPGELLRIASEPFTLIVPSVVMAELNTIAGRTGRRASAARFALQNLPRIKALLPVEVAQEPGFPARADDWIFKYAQKNHSCVATNDVALRRRLLALGVPIIAVKGKSKLDYV
ncbi:MAG: PIN domain-containing protein [Candidatus Micrarchaeota archaeon]|nr:PIN domain-containing protein [Candidatus Micrarchaeota archaeon]